MISIIIPSYNNLRHLKNAVASIRKHAPTVELVLLDDGSTDNTWEWIQTQDCIAYKSDERVGHTILYDVGIQLATKEIVGILHADMIIGPNYVENLLRHLRPGVVVCATRIEPPLHPPGREKIIRDFGMDFDSLKIDEFERFCYEFQSNDFEATSKGMFAPWIIYKEDFLAIGGHDPQFAPFPYEDSDIFQRWILNGYELMQSRSALVYHLTCRGHRWTDRVGKDDEFFKACSIRSGRNYLRKWGTWIQNDLNQHPIIMPKYFVTIQVPEMLVTDQMIYNWEPFCSKFEIVRHADALDTGQYLIDEYIEDEQCNTLTNLQDKFSIVDDINDSRKKGVLIQVSEPDQFVRKQAIDQNLERIPYIVQTMVRQKITEYPLFGLGLKFTIYDTEELQHTLIHVN